MNRFAFGLVFIASVGGAVVAHGKSFLSAESFPTTFADTPFVERMAVRAAGYVPYEPDYDSNGRCISGCAYARMNIEDELETMRRNSDMAREHLRQLGITPPRDTAPTTTSETPPLAPTVVTQTPPNIVTQPTPPVQTAANNPPPAAADRTCTPNHPGITPGNKVPFGEPLVGRPQITSAYGDRIHPTKRRRIPHWGIDFAAAIGTDVFAPADGIVSNVSSDSACGQKLVIDHANGFQTVYCHLDRQLVRVGDAVSAGCRVATTGNTGDTTGSHLHYAILYNGTYVNPADYFRR